MSRNQKALILSLPLFLLLGAGTAEGKRSQTALSLLEAPNARASSLGEAFSSVEGDISAFSYNPASLYPIETGQASFLLERGINDDSFGHFSIGYPFEKRSLGLSVGYYNGGQANLFDGTNEKSVTLQQDLAISLGMAGAIKHVAYGITGKYISSEIAETASASAFAADLGINAPMFKNARIGASLQNIGTSLKYVSEERDLPMQSRLGASVKIPSKNFTTTLMADGVYQIDNSQFVPQVGIEASMGILSFRMGYKGGSDLENISAGTGFKFGRHFLDYSFGLVDELNSRHRISVGMEFGRIGLSREFVKNRNNSKNRYVYQRPKDKKTARMISPLPAVFSRNVPKVAKGRVYVVKEGDTLKSISQRYYGYPTFSGYIYNANQHLISNPEQLTPGQKLVLPHRRW